MARIDTLKNFLVDIADKFRSILGTTEEISHAEYDAKIDEVFEAGKLAERKEYYRNLIKARTLENGALNATHMFSYEHPDYFYPTEDLKINTCSSMFLRFGTWVPYNLKTISLTQRLEDCGIKLDMSKQSGVTSYMFNYTCFTELPEISFIGTYSSTILNYTFDENLYLERIEKLIVKPNATSTHGFRKCTALTSMILEVINGGKIKGTWDFSYTKLDPPSMKSIILCLFDYSGTSEEGMYSILFPEPCWEALEADSTAPDGGTWENYVIKLGYLK